MKRIVVLGLLVLGAMMFLKASSWHVRFENQPAQVIEVPPAPPAAEAPVVIHFAGDSRLEARPGRVSIIVSDAEATSESGSAVHEFPARIFAEDSPVSASGTAVATVPESGEPATGPALTRVASDWKIDPEQARDDLETRIRRTVADWLAPAGVPSDWTPPRRLVKRLLQGQVTVASDDRDYARLYRASQDVDSSPELRSQMVQAYRRHVAGVWMGGSLAFALAGLTILTGYIRADEATKGYYTKRLRFAAAGALGGAGVLLYQWITRAL